jgi:Cft2 family RNA processing exonuclease
MLYFETVHFTNLTRASEIGANSYLLDFGPDGRIILDAGMHPRADGAEGLPQLSLAPIDSIDAIIVTHAHHDHIGALPVLMREQTRARVFMSEATYFLAEPLLHNSVEIMLKQRAEKGIVEYPLYTHKELDQCVKVWQACGTDRSWSLRGYPDPENEPLTFTFYDAGHILGAIGVEINHRGRKIFYTGDVNFTGQTLVRKADFPRTPVDALIIETTRGNHPPGQEPYSREKEMARLEKLIQDTYACGGAVLIPVFAMGKTQEMLASLHFLQRQGRIPNTPIYISGLSRSFTQIYDKLAQRTSREHANLNLLHDVGPQIMDGRIARQLKPRRGHIYLISSGMMTEHTLSNLFAQNFLADKRHTIVFVGYCDPDSPAGRLRATPPGGKVVLDPSIGEQPVLCRVEAFDFTAHAQREDLLAFIEETQPRLCLLVHGDPGAQDWFRAQLAEKQPQMKVISPPSGEAIEV